MTEQYRLSPFVYGLTRIVITTPLKLLFRMELVGGENWPERGPAIIASNHSSMFDPPLVGLSYQGKIRWMAKSDLFGIPGFSWLITRLGAFPVRRGEADRDAIRMARELLDEGYIVGMFPEGTRFREGRLGKPQTGIGMLAMQPGVPVIPVRIRGDERIIRGGRPHLPRITVTVGPPVDLEITDMSKGKTYHEAARRIMAAIEAL